MLKGARKPEHIHKGQKGLDILVLIIITLTRPKGYTDGSTTFLKNWRYFTQKKRLYKFKMQKKKVIYEGFQSSKVRRNFFKKNH